MTVSDPIAILSIQRTDEKDDQNATVFEHPSQVYMQGQVQYESSKEGMAGTLVLDLYNVEVEELLHLHPNGIVKLEAGYKTNPTDPERSAPMSTIFYGFLDHAYPYRSGGETVIRVSAITIPSRMLAVKFNYSLKDAIPAIEYAKRIASFIGGTVSGTAFAHTVKMPAGYTPKFGLMDELRLVTAVISEVSGRPHRLTTPIQDPFHFRISDDTEGADTGITEKLHLDFDVDAIQNVGISVSRKEVALEGGVGEQSDESKATPAQQQTPIDAFLSSLIDKSLSVEMDITMQFDPRVSIGMYVIATGKVEGTIEIPAVASVRHNIGKDWETNFGGPAIGTKVVGA